MTLLFNKYQNGALELRDLTGAYYANNDFNRISTDVRMATRHVRRLIGAELYSRAASHYQGNDFRKESPSEAQALNDQLVDLIRTPIAFLASFNFYQANLVSHEDTGRKVKIDNENEKMAWEWMLDRDDAAQIRKYHRTFDDLLDWLEEHNIPEWMQSENRLQARVLFVNSETIFQDVFPIDSSPRFFYTVLPFNREVQEGTIRKTLGARYQPLLQYWQSISAAGSGSGSASGGIPGESDPLFTELLPLVQKAIPMLVMSVAVKRLTLQVLPDGVVQQFRSMFQSRQSSQAPTLDMIREYSKLLASDANYLLQDVKELLQSADPEAGKFTLSPTNDDANKFFRT